MPEAFFIAAAELAAASEAASVGALALAGTGGATLGGTVAASGVFAGITAGALGGFALNAGLAIGASFLASALVKRADAPDFTFGAPPPTASSQQQTIRQSTAPRSRHYGLVKVGGVLAFYDVKAGKLYGLIALGQGEIDDIAEHWLSNTRVTLDGSGFVTDAQYQYGGTSRVQIVAQHGLDSQTAQAKLLADWSEVWSSNDRGRGVPNVLCIFQDVPIESFRTVYPQSAPQYRAVINGAKVFDGNDEAQSSSDSATWGYSESPPNCILDFLTHADGMGRPRALFDETLFAAPALRCDEDVTLNPVTLDAAAACTASDATITATASSEAIYYYAGREIVLLGAGVAGANLVTTITSADSANSEFNVADAPSTSVDPLTIKVHGTEKRYRLCGSYNLNEAPLSVLGRMLQTCDGELYLTAAGKYGMRVGVWYAPTVTIEDKDILSYQLQEYTDAISAYNQIKPFYTSPQHDFQEQEAEQWDDDALIDLYGFERVQELHMPMVPSPSQARRLGKISIGKGNPQWSGKIVTNLVGLRALGESVVTFRLSELDIDTTFKVTQIDIAADLSSVTMSVFSIDSTLYDWDGTTEEGTPPIIPVDAPPSPGIAVPTGLNVIAAQLTVSGSVSAAVFRADWDTPSRDSISHEINYKLHSDSVWTSFRIPAGTEVFDSEALADGEEYDVRLRAIGPGGTVSDWTATANVTATADTTPPGQPTGFNSSKAGSDVTLSWVNPNSPNFYKTELWRSSTNSFGTATAVATLYGSAGSSRSYIDTALANGTYYWWVQAFNASNVSSTQVGSTTQTIP